MCQLVECAACGARRHENRNQRWLEVSPWWDERARQEQERREAVETERAERKAVEALRRAYGDAPDVIRTEDGFIALRVGSCSGTEILIGTSMQDAVARTRTADAGKVRAVLANL